MGNSEIKAVMSPIVNLDENFDGTQDIKEVFSIKAFKDSTESDAQQFFGKIKRNGMTPDSDRNLSE